MSSKKMSSEVEADREERRCLLEEMKVIQKKLDVVEERMYQRLHKHGLMKLKICAPGLLANIIGFIASDPKTLVSFKLSSILKQFNDATDPLNGEEVSRAMDKLLSKNIWHYSVKQHFERVYVERRYNSDFYLNLVFNSKMIIFKILKELPRKYEEEIGNMDDSPPLYIGICRSRLTERGHDIKFLIENYDINIYEKRSMNYILNLERGLDYEGGTENCTILNCAVGQTMSFIMIDLIECLLKQPLIDVKATDAEQCNVLHASPQDPELWELFCSFEKCFSEDVMNAVNQHGETPLDMLYCLYQVAVEDEEDEDDLRGQMQSIEFLRSKGLKRQADL